MKRRPWLSRGCPDWPAWERGGLSAVPTRSGQGDTAQIERINSPDSPYRRSRRVSVIVVLAVAATAMLLVPFWPYLTADFWPTVWDQGGHRVPLREWGSWLAQGRTIGWDHSWFNGYPVYQFYFPGGWFIWQLFNTVLPEVAAYRLMTVATFPASVLAVWWLGRTWGLSLARSGVLAACVAVGFAFAPVGAATVGYAHQWAVVFGLLYLAALNKSGRRWGTWPTVAFLSLTAAFLCHPYPAAIIGAASLLLLPKLGWRIFVKGVSLVAGLTAWWWLPFIAHLDLAYLDMTRWHPPWLEILMVGSFVRLFDITSWLPLAAIGSGALLVLAAVGGRRLARTVPDRRVLYPFAAMMALPLANRLVATLGLAEGASEFFGFQGGRLFFIWYMAVPSLALYAAVDIARGANAKFRTLRVDSVVSLTLVAVAALAVTTSQEADPLLVPNTLGRLNVPPASVDASVATSTWLSTTRWVVNGRSSAAFYAPAADTGRSVGGLHRESSPTARFLPALPLPEWVRWGWGGILDPNVPVPTATRTTWPVPQMQSFGVDIMWEPPTDPQGDVSWVASSFRLLDVPAPPDTWPLVWIPPATTTYRGFLEHSLEAFGSWDSTEDVTIPVWGDPPPNGRASDMATTADVDWSDDRFVRFYADHGGLYYAAASWHPNWTLTTVGAGPWPAGPNQMVVWADTPGLVELTWGKHWSESAGQAVSALTSLVLVVGSLPATRLRRPQETGAGGSGPLLPLNKAPRKAGHP